MCPCVLLKKLKGVFSRKKRESNNSSDNSNLSTEDMNGSKEPTNKKGGEGEDKKNEANRKTKSHQSGYTMSVDCASSDGDTSKLTMNLPCYELLGQVVHNKPNPKNYLKRILQTERPDLVGLDNTLTENELKMLDGYLLQKGEMRNGISLTLGAVVECDSSLMVGVGEDVTVITLYARGRFASIYLIHRQANQEQQRAGLGNAMAMKTSRRMYASTRLQHEITVLSYLFDSKNSEKRKKKISLPTHITPIFFHGIAGGTPYLIMPMMDANLAKIRQEIGEKFSLADFFYIGQEALIGIKECHEHSIVHRDIKPANLVLSIKMNKNWWLCDFGDSCAIGDETLLSPPDALTLPYLSRVAHEAVQRPTKATIFMDLESWLYMLLELFTVLPWRDMVEEDETLNCKKSFWESYEEFFVHNTQLPPQLLQITQIVADTTIKKPYSQLTAILRDGFTSNNEGGAWKPCWIKARAEGSHSKSQKNGQKKKSSSGETAKDKESGSKKKEKKGSGEPQSKAKSKSKSSKEIKEIKEAKETKEKKESGEPQSKTRSKSKSKESASTPV